MDGHGGTQAGRPERDTERERVFGFRALARTQADVQGRGIAAKAGLNPTVDDVAPASAGDPSGRPLLSGFYSTFTAIVPQGSGVALLRSIEYFGGNGAQTPIVTLAIWAAAGGVLAIFAAVPATRRELNYRSVHDRYLPGLAGRDRAVLQPGLLSPVD
jgi:hypothetical protein